jgi:transcriptional regulator with XRE-family HTH domain
VFLTIDDVVVDGSSFSERLADAMQEAKINAAALAAAVGVSQSAVSQWLSSTVKSLKPEHLFSVSDTLNVDPRWLATGHGDRRPKVRPELLALSEEQIAAILALIRR